MSPISISERWFMRRSKLIIVGAAIALLMAGCSLANSQNTPEPVEPAATSQEAEENAKTNGNVLLTTGVKSAGEYTRGHPDLRQEVDLQGPAQMDETQRLIRI